MLRLNRRIPPSAQRRTSFSSGGSGGPIRSPTTWTCGRQVCPRSSSGWSRAMRGRAQIPARTRQL